VVHELVNGSMDGAAELVTRVTLAKGLALNFNFLIAESVSDVVCCK